MKNNNIKGWLSKYSNGGDDVPITSAPTIIPTDALRTFDFGKLEGTKQTDTKNKEIHNTIINSPHLPMAGEGETWDEAVNRVVPTLQNIVANSPANTTLVTHNSVFGLINLWNEEGRPSEFSKEGRERYTKQDGDYKTGDTFSIQGNNGPIIVARHGETNDNLAGNFRRSDAELTDKGVKQAKQVGKKLSDIPIPEIISSPLDRTLATSNIIASQQGDLKKNSEAKNGGWLEKYSHGGDNYGHEDNLNDANVSTPPNFVGLGYDITPRRYSPAWGGQFADGGKLNTANTFRNAIGNIGKYFFNINDNNLLESEYRPTKGDAPNIKYYNREGMKEDVYKDLTSPEVKKDYNQNGSFEDIFNALSNNGEDRSNNAENSFPNNKAGYHGMYNNGHGSFTGEFNLGRYRTDAGQDNKGKYISFSDIYDWNGMPNKERAIHYYDRIYQNDWNLMKNNVDAISYKTGGSVPGSVGFMYARTGDIPSNGKHAKKTRASAENGTEMRYYQEGLDFQPKTISENGSTNPYHEITEYNPIHQDSDIYGQGVYGIIKSPMEAYNFEQSYRNVQNTQPSQDTIKLTDANNRFNTSVDRGTVTDLVKGALEKGLDPRTVLAMSLQETGINRLNPLHDNSQDLENYDTMKKYAESHPEGINNKTITDNSLDNLVSKFKYAKKLGKTNEADIIQGWNGYGKVKDMYGIPGEINMSKNPVYGKRVLDIRDNIINKNPEINNIISSVSKSSLKDGGELFKLNQLSNFTQTGEPNRNWLSQYK